MKQRGALGVSGLSSGLGGGDVDADRKRAHIAEVAVTVHGEALAVDAGFEGAVYGIEKIIAMSLDVEADKIGSEQAVEKLALPGADPERFRIRPGNVPEDRDAGIGPRFFDHARDQCEMIILNEDDRIRLAGRFFEKSVGEAAVDVLVLIPILCAEVRARVGDVA